MVERLRLAVPGLVLARECKIQGHLQIKSLVKLERRVCNPEKVQKENGSGRKKAERRSEVPCAPLVSDATSASGKPALPFA